MRNDAELNTHRPADDPEQQLHAVQPPCEPGVRELTFAAQVKERLAPYAPNDSPVATSHLSADYDSPPADIDKMEGGWRTLALGEFDETRFQQFAPPEYREHAMEYFQPYMAKPEFAELYRISVQIGGLYPVMTSRMSGDRGIGENLQKLEDEFATINGMHKRGNYYHPLTTR